MYIPTKNYVVVKWKCFSTISCLLSPEGSSSGLTKEHIKKIMEDFENKNPKPEFKSPGYPNFETMANRSKTKYQYKEMTERFKDRHSTQSVIAEYYTQQQNYVEAKVHEENLDITSEEVAKEVRSKQREDYSEDLGHRYERGEFSHKEALWREKLNQRASEAGKDLTDSDSDNLSEGSTGSGIVLTPRLAYSPTPENEDNKTHSTRACAENKSENSSTNKRNISSIEEVGESSSQPPKRFKQDSSDVTGDTEPFDFGGGDD